MPELILLDLDLPGINGFEVLNLAAPETRKSRHLLVIVLTTSTYSSDLKKAYQLGAETHS